jgi:hypothetical protein
MLIQVLFLLLLIYSMLMTALVLYGRANYKDLVALEEATSEKMIETRKLCNDTLLKYEKIIGQLKDDLAKSKEHIAIVERDLRTKELQYEDLQLRVFDLSTKCDQRTQDLEVALKDQDTMQKNLKIWEKLATQANESSKKFSEQLDSIAAIVNME